jgi:glycosyltransferase involved in cell wall biosynthesis
MKKPKPFISIVVPTWNGGAMIGETIDSLLNQDFPHSQYEIIIVDDASTDNTLERLEAFSGRVRVFQQSKAGSASARNLGIHRADGDYLVCFDQDDILFPYALQVYRGVIDAFDRPPVVLAQYIQFRGGEVINPGSGNPARVNCVKCRDYFGKTVQTEVLNSIFVLRRDSVLHAGCYSSDTASYDDHDLLFKLGTASPMVKILHPPTVAYRIHDRNATRDAEFLLQGTLALIRNERLRLYPGGWRRLLDRRGLIGSNVLSICYRSFFRARHMPLHRRLALINRLLLHARGLVFVALVRKGFSRFYSQELRSLDSVSSPRVEVDSHGGTESSLADDDRKPTNELTPRR